MSAPTQELANVREPSTRHVALLRTATFAAMGVALAGCLLAGAWSWWNAAESRQAQRSAMIEAAAMTLRESTAPMLAEGDLTSVRRTLGAAARQFELEWCRLSLPDGRIIASSLPSEINLLHLPETWTGGRVADQVQRLEDGRTQVRLGVTAPGRGELSLQVVGARASGVGLDMQWAMGCLAIALSAGGGVVIILTRQAARVSVLGMIRGALDDFDRGCTDPGVLSLGPRFGAVAAAWNRMVDAAARVKRIESIQATLAGANGRRQGGGGVEAACDMLRHGVVVVATEQGVVYANGAAAGLLKRDRDSLRGSGVDAINLPHAAFDLVHQTLAGAVQQRRSVLLGADDQQSDGLLKFTVGPARLDGATAAVLIIEDMTQQAAAEAARHQFLASAAHELRAPLTNILLNVEMAQADEGEPKVVAQCLNVINHEALRLERTVGDILSISEIEAGSLQMHVDDVRVEDVFNDLEHSYKAQARERGVELIFNRPPKFPVLQGDRDKLIVALQNLLGNAVKYTPKGGVVTVTIEVDADALTVRVVDTGIGIAEDDQQRIFDKFYRARDSRLSEITGSGLGLALAREVVRMHGGDIQVESVLDQGSTFTLTLPTPRMAA